MGKNTHIKNQKFIDELKVQKGNALKAIQSQLKVIKILDDQIDKLSA